MTGQPLLTAAGITALDWSRTVPLTVAVLACGYPDGAVKTISRMQKMVLGTHVNLDIGPPFASY